MTNSILQAIICSEFSQRFGRERKDCKDGYSSSRNEAMKLKFSLSPDYDIEDGYRNLEILIFGGGCNYISVFARLDWTVIRNEWSSGDGLLPGKEYIEGRTSWVLRCCHDSCWRDAVGSLLHEFGGRITSIDWVFGGWYKTVPVSDEERKMFSSMSQSDRIDLADLEFKFDKTASD